jgi:hypothetical protein
MDEPHGRLNSCASLRRTRWPFGISSVKVKWAKLRLGGVRS